jgi:aspartyl-tRNA(Asn)/glutamyl-tRNA(Gln) amidotransferase subunit B
MEKSPLLCIDNTEEYVNKILSLHMEIVKKYKMGEIGLLGFLVGEIMKLSKGSVSPKRVKEVLDEKLAYIKL